MVSKDAFATVVGAGPSGLLLGVLLAQNNIPVTLIEKSDGLDKQPRATHYSGPAVAVLHRAGILDDLDSQGFMPDKLSFRTAGNRILASIDHTGLAKDENRLRCLPLDKLGDILLSHLKKQSNVTILWGHEVTGISDDGGVGVVTIECKEETKTLRSRFVVGCDGANSKIRRLLFGDWEFPGKTWETQVVATNVYYDFHQFGYDDANFIIDPKDWYMASRISREGMWRVSYGVPASLTIEELRAQQPLKWKQMLPGNPSPDQYRITNFSPYKVHQRLAASMRVGPFVLAADAAHLCSPFGGLGLTSGIVDVGGLADCLIGIHENKADDSILDIYSQVRREKYEKFVNPVSSENLVRMYDSHPDTILERDDGLRRINEVASDPNKMKELINGINIIDYDFTQHYNCRARLVDNS